MEDLPKEIIREIIVRLPVKDGVNLCSTAQMYKKLLVKNYILQAVQMFAAPGSGFVVDVSNLNPSGHGIRQVQPPGSRSNKMTIPGYPIIVNPQRYNFIVDILNTQ